MMLSTEITDIDLDKNTIYTNNDKFEGDLIVSTTSPDFCLNCCELNYVGREFYNCIAN